MNDYESLKKLLFDDEAQAIQKLKSELSVLLKETQDHDLIIQRLTPVIGELLKETITNSSDEISKVMAPIMGDAIKEQVKTQKDTIVDALYPVMGNMIAKFVSSALKDMLDEINAKVQNNLSMGALKRKIKARFKGVSESELLLQEAQFGSIETIFLIHTASGLMMWEGSKEEGGVVEAEMLSAMLSAIRSFVNEWVAKNDEVFELNTIEYGDSKIYLEVSGSCYLAVVVRGEIRVKMQERITAALSNLVEKYGEDFSEFNGDTSQLNYEAIGARLQQLFTIDKAINTAKPKDVSPFLLLLPILLVAALAYFYFDNYQQEQKQELIMDKFYHAPELNLYKIDAKIISDEVILSGMLPNERLRLLAESLVDQKSLHVKVRNDIVLSVPIVTPEEIEAKRILIDKLYNNQEDVTLSSQFNNGVITISGTVSNTPKMQEIIQEFSEIKGVEKVISSLRLKPEKITQQLSYDVAKSDLSSSQKEILDMLISRYKLDDIAQQYSGYTLNVFAFTDGIGDLKSNAEFAYKRAKNVYDYLIKQGVDKAYIRYKAINSPPEDYNISLDSRKARVSRFIWSEIDD
jgi:outer membrane protein OmpA-like peptidoglycan-associated protein